MKSPKDVEEKKVYEKPRVIFKSALEAYAQTCLGSKAKGIAEPGCEFGSLLS